MAIAKRVGNIMLDTLEIYIPTAAFLTMFVVFNLNVFYRYFLNNPLTWPPEVISIAFIWTTVLGACYAQRKADHVAFTVIYDRLAARSQLFFRLIGNGFIAFAFMLALKPTYDYVTFMDFKATTVLKIPFSIAFAPFLIFMILIIGRMFHAIYLDLRMLFGLDPLVRDAPNTEVEFLDALAIDTSPSEGSNHGA